MKLNRVNELIGRIFGDTKVQQDEVTIVSNAARKAEKQYAVIEKEKRLQVILIKIIETSTISLVQLIRVF